MPEKCHSKNHVKVPGLVVLALGLVLLAPLQAGAQEIWTDGFESGRSCPWSRTATAGDLRRQGQRLQRRDRRELHRRQRLRAARRGRRHHRCARRRLRHACELHRGRPRRRPRRHRRSGHHLRLRSGAAHHRRDLGEDDHPRSRHRRRRADHPGRRRHHSHPQARFVLRPRLSAADPPVPQPGNGSTAHLPGTDVDSGGAAVFRLGGSLVILDCIFQDNIGPSTGQDVAGGAVYSLGIGNTVISGSTFINNSCSSGGAIGNLHNHLELVNSTVLANSATGNRRQPGKRRQRRRHLYGRRQPGLRHLRLGDLRQHRQRPRRRPLPGLQRRRRRR